MSVRSELHDRLKKEFPNSIYEIKAGKVREKEKPVNIYAKVTEMREYDNFKKAVLDILAC